MCTLCVVPIPFQGIFLKLSITLYYYYLCKKKPSQIIWSNIVCRKLGILELSWHHQGDPFTNWGPQQRNCMYWSLLTLGFNGWPLQKALAKVSKAIEMEHGASCNDGGSRPWALSMWWPVPWIEPDGQVDGQSIFLLAPHNNSRGSSSWLDRFESNFLFLQQEHVESMSRHS